MSKYKEPELILKERMISFLKSQNYYTNLRVLAHLTTFSNAKKGLSRKLFSFKLGSTIDLETRNVKKMKLFRNQSLKLFKDFGPSNEPTVHGQHAFLALPKTGDWDDSKNLSSERLDYIDFAFQFSSENDLDFFRGFPVAELKYDIKNFFEILFSTTAEPNASFRVWDARKSNFDGTSFATTIKRIMQTNVG